MKKSRAVPPPTETLTPRQLEILKFIRDGRRANGYSPTLQEAADHLGLSKVTIFEHVEALIRKGYLTRRNNRARSLELTAAAVLPDDRPTLIPLVGRIAAGYPIEAVEAPDEIDLEAVFSSRHPVRILQVTGDSMIEEQIRSGDLVVYEERSDARNGDVVVAIIENDEATLKKYYKERGRVRLQPANSAFKPIILPDRSVKVLGVVIGMIRRM